MPASSGYRIAGRSGSGGQEIRFYWYPHIREDYNQELGLYGNVLVEPADPDYWAPVDRELCLTLDDILLEHGRIAPFSRVETTYSAMGRASATCCSSAARRTSR